jgi:hypothetical protein
MEAVIIKHKFTSGISLKEVVAVFFKAHAPEDTKVLFWKFFQCWVTRDCDIKADLSNEEVALFFDQLNKLIDAAYNVYLESNELPDQQEGSNNE